MEAELSEFGGMLHQWRGRHGMSQLELSTASGVSSRHISFQPVVRGQMFSWFSTLATIGTPQDVTLDELMIESLFPADDVTAYLVGELAADGLPGRT
jgi:transcriptional regulator with XRE-family HTH domain